MRVLVVGGGVAGMLTAGLLAAEGWAVQLVDRHRLGGEASWAGGGIVSPLYPWRYGAAVSALSNWSRAYYPGLGARLLSATGVDPEVRQTGLYWLDLEDEQWALEWSAREGGSLRQVTMSEVLRQVPQVGKSFQRAVHMADIANVRNPRLLQALRMSLAGIPSVQVLEHCAVKSLQFNGQRVTGVATEEGCLRADHVVLAAGAWSGELLATLGFFLPVEPVKGQMILYKCSEDFLPAMVLAKGRYAIPRKDGHILVGSTLEHVGFDKAPTDVALASLKASAEELLPALADGEVVGHWAGLRPSSPEGIPFIGEVPQCPGLWLNCGHYRNGLVLAPASCELLKNLMLGEAPIVDPKPYSPLRRLRQS